MRIPSYLKLRKTKTLSGGIIHQCCMCGFCGVWNKNWSWYGNLREEGHGKRLDKLCSAKCREDYCEKYGV